MKVIIVTAYVDNDVNDLFTWTAVKESPKYLAIVSLHYFLLWEFKICFTWKIS